LNPLSSNKALVAQSVSLNLKSVSVLEGIDFEVPEASFFCVTGPNGAGKTLFTRLLLGDLRCSQGQIKLWELPPQDIPSDWIGFVPQVKGFDRRFPALAEEFVATGIYGFWPWRMKPSDRKLILQQMEQLHAGHLWNRSLSTLSGGELQRLYLARAFMRPRKLLILDEPTTGIDSFGEADLYALLENYRQRTHCCILMITHDLDVARHHATHVMVINRKQLAFGSARDALSPKILERAFGHSQHHHHHEEHPHD
jgi:zinc transport system ATP-binding protein